MNIQPEMIQVTYVSEKTSNSDKNLTDIFEISQKNNPEKSITGCLLIGSNSYLQLLEGPTLAVEELYAKIIKDSRHKNVKKLYDQVVEERLFSSWSMKFAPFENLDWSNKEFNSGNFLNIEPDGAENIFNSIKRITLG